MYVAATRRPCFWTSVNSPRARRRTRGPSRRDMISVAGRDVEAAQPGQRGLTRATKPSGACDPSRGGASGRDGHSWSPSGRGNRGCVADDACWADTCASWDSRPGDPCRPGETRIVAVNRAPCQRPAASPHTPQVLPRTPSPVHRDPTFRTSPANDCHDKRAVVDSPAFRWRRCLPGKFSTPVEKSVEIRAFWNHLL